MPGFTAPGSFLNGGYNRNSMSLGGGVGTRESMSLGGGAPTNRDSMSINMMDKTSFLNED